MVFKEVMNFTRSLSQNRVCLGFLLGFFLVSLTYFTVSEQFAISSPTALFWSTPAHVENSSPSLQEKPNSLQQDSTKDGVIKHKDKPTVTPDNQEGKIENLAEVTADKPICDLSNPRFDLCEMTGDGRTLGASSTVLYLPPPGKSNVEAQEWSIRVQSRKYLPWINKVTIKSLNASIPVAACTIRHNRPAIVFALGGLTANPWHDFSDVIIPLFITSREFDGNVQFLITGIQHWWVKKYKLILKKLSRYEIIDFDKDNQVRCYPHIIVGLRSHRDLGIEPTYSPQKYSMVDFRMFIREVYSLHMGIDIPYKVSDNPNKKPRLLLIARGKTRRFMNLPEIIQAMETVGFEVIRAEPQVDMSIEELARIVDSCDVLMGAHGAGLTNVVFLRTNAVLLQVVPYGHLEYMADGFYGGPAQAMKLNDVEYSINVEESTLLKKLGWDDPVIKDPDSIHKSSWEKVGEFYMFKQDIVLNLTRFAPTLERVLKLVKE